MEKTVHPLRSLRAQRSMSQADLADQLNVSQSLVSQIEKGIKAVTAKRAKEWAPILGVSRSTLCPDIFGGELEVVPTVVSDGVRAVLERLISRVGGLKRFTHQIGESPETVANWRARGVSIEGCKKIERIFKIDRVLLRPDIFGGYQ